MRQYLFLCGIFCYARGMYTYYRVNLNCDDTKTPGRICRPWWNHRNNIFSNQIKQMIAQKNRKDTTKTDTYLPECMVDFELLWRCISKIRTTSHVATYTKDFSNLNKKKVYNNGTVQFAMFILVSTPLGLVTGGLSGPPWSAF